MRYVRLTENLITSAILIALIALFAVTEQIQQWLLRKKQLTATSHVLVNPANG